MYRIHFLPCSDLDSAQVSAYGIDILIKQGTTKVLQLAHPSPLLPPLPQVIVHLSGTNSLTTVLPKSLSYTVDILILKALVSPTTIRHYLGHPPKDKP
jgi:hypothetical protein